MLRLPEMPEVKFDAVPLSGGLDQVTSAYQLAPGALRECVNWACRPQGGYYRIPGYERFDGRPAPSDATYTLMRVAMLEDYDLNDHLSIGTTFTAQLQPSGTWTATVCDVDHNNAIIAVTKNASAPYISALMDGMTIVGLLFKHEEGVTIKEHARLKAAAAAQVRADIAVVPGSGPIRGVCYLNDIAYAFRDNAGATACDIYKSTSGGWSQVALYSKLAFTALTEMPIEDSTLTQGAVTATIKRTVITSGDVVANDAAGYFIVTTPSGGAFTAATSSFNGTPSGTATLGGNAVPITLAPGGKYNFSTGNFNGHYSGTRIYGADGVNDMFEFDGTVYVPIPLATASKPRYVMVHSDHLFATVESSLFHSAIGNPYDMQVITGAGEIGTGGFITGLLIMPGTQDTAALLVTARNSTWVLYGTDVSTWKFVAYKGGLGALDRTVQGLFDAFALDDRGVIAMKQSLNYGNFDAGALTYNIRPFITSNRNKATCSGINRENSQYRVFFSNGYGLYVTSNADSQLIGHGVVLFPDTQAPQCMFDGEKSTGETVELFGTADGYVMQNDKGTSFDGAGINSFIMLNINAVKSPRLRKRFRRAVIELQGSSHVELQVGYSFDWANEFVLPHAFNSVEQSFSAMPFWDSMTWDMFFWDGRSNDAVSVELTGTGENFQMMLSTADDDIAEFTASSVIFHYSPRRGNR